MSRLSLLGSASAACALLAAPLAADDAAQSDPLRAAEARADALLALTAASSAGIENAFADEARAAFAAAGAQACPGAAPRIAVLPNGPDGSMAAYLLSVSEAGGSAFTGGHYRVTLARDGNAGELTRFGDGCAALTWDPADEDLGMRVGYLQRSGAAMPSEIDLWLSHQVPFALGVVTPPMVWLVVGGRADIPVEADAEMIAGE